MLFSTWPEMEGKIAGLALGNLGFWCQELNTIYIFTEHFNSNVMLCTTEKDIVKVEKLRK